MFTNGLKLDKEYTHKLKKAGIKYVVLQFDGFSDDVYRKLRGKKLLRKKLEAISNLRKEHIITDLFSVIIKNINEDEIKKIIKYASENSETIKNVYLSTITYEGRYDLKLERVTNIERLNLVEKQIGISQKDFLICTEFDYYLANFIKKLTGTESKHLSACDIMCYVYANSGKIIPLNKIVNLECFIDFLKKSIKILNQNSKFKYVELIHNFLNFLFSKKILIDKSYAYNIFKFAIFSFAPLAYRKPAGNKFKNIFRVIITQFQDKYNVDFATFKNCNLLADIDDGIVEPFCKKLLFNY